MQTRWLWPVLGAGVLAATLGARPAESPSFEFARIVFVLSDPGSSGLERGRYELVFAGGHAREGRAWSARLRPLDRRGDERRVRFESRGCEVRAGKSSRRRFGAQSRLELLPAADGGRELHLASQDDAECVLIGLLLPAVQKVREGAARSGPASGPDGLAGETKPLPAPRPDPGDPGPYPVRPDGALDLTARPLPPPTPPPTPPPPPPAVQSDARAELAALPSAADLGRLRGARVRAAALRLRAALERLARPARDKHATLRAWDDYEEALRGLDQSVWESPDYSTRSFKCRGEQDRCQAACGRRLGCGCVAAHVACLAS